MLCWWDNDVLHGGVIGANSGEEAIRPEQVEGGSDPFLVTRRNISMSRGTFSPERSNHRRIVSADECCVVRSRICKDKVVTSARRVLVWQEQQGGTTQPGGANQNHQSNEMKGLRIERMRSCSNGTRQRGKKSA